MKKTNSSVNHHLCHPPLPYLNESMRKRLNQWGSCALTLLLILTAAGCASASPASGNGLSSSDAGSFTEQSEGSISAGSAAGRNTGADSDDRDDIIEVPEAGVTFRLPDSFKNTMGIVNSDAGELNYGDGVVSMYYMYVGMNEEDYQALQDMSARNKSSEQECIDFYNERCRGLFTVYGASGNRTPEEINQYLHCLQENRDPNGEINYLEGAEKMAEAGDYSFYFVDDTQPDCPPEEQSNYSVGSYFNLEGFGAEYQMLVDDVKTVVRDSLSFSEPVSEYKAAEKGTRIQFETMDVKGNPVTSEELFSKNKVTMINIWGTFCAPCISEMPELVRLNSEFRKDGCGIIGIIGDALGPDDTDTAGQALTILDDSNVDYRNILPWDGLEDQIPLSVFPTTYFVDSEGYIIGTPVLGADPGQYKEKMRLALEQLN